jgi:hypothetical protein
MPGPQFAPVRIAHQLAPACALDLPAAVLRSAEEFIDLRRMGIADTSLATAIGLAGLVGNFGVSQ